MKMVWTWMAVMGIFLLLGGCGRNMDFSGLQSLARTTRTAQPSSPDPAPEELATSYEIDDLED